MFELETAIKKWRKTLNANQALEDGVKEELECHLRDKIEYLMVRGASEKDAFDDAAGKIGEPDFLGSEYYKTGSRHPGAKPPWEKNRWIPGLAANYFKIGFRKIKRQRFFSFINIAGLAVGLACCAVIILYVVNELTYDSYHKDAEHIFRISTHTKNQVGEFRMATTSGPLGGEIRAALPQSENVVRVVPPYENAEHTLVVRGERRFFEKRLFFADNGIFQLFRIPFIQGSAETALIDPYSVVITKDMAAKYFGDESPLDKVLRIEIDYDTGDVGLRDYTVTGVIGNAPANTHLKYDMLLSFPSLIANLPSFETDWLNPKTKYTYVKLAPSTDPADFEKRLQVFAETHKRMYQERFDRTLALLEFELQPVTRIHMSSTYRRELESPGSWTYVYVYSLVAFLILMIGGMNFINLSAALATTRAKEVGLRKVVGAQKRQLIGQFLGESFLITIISFSLAFMLISILMAPFNRMAGTELSLAGMNQPVVLLSLVGLLVFVAVGSGLYPAFILNANRPASVLGGKSTPSARGSRVQKGLVIGQFAISIFLAICTLSAFKQLTFMRGRALGFDMEQKLILRVKSHLPHLRRDYEAIKRDFMRHPSIIGAAVSSSVPGDGDRGGYHMTTKSEDFRGVPFIHVITMDYDFIELYGIRMEAGRPFERESGNDEVESYLVNRTAARELGFASPEEAIGKRFQAHYHRKTKRIVGVTEDFHYNGMREAVEPLVLDIEPSLMSTLTLSIRTDNLPDLMRFVRETWDAQFPGVPFEYAFLDQEFDRVYRYEEQMSRLLGTITFLGLIIACLGLFGLVSFVIRYRTKEIGIRKVLGARTADIVALLSKNFTLLILTSIVIASPLAFFAMNAWLRDFAYRIPIKGLIFLLAGGGALAAALATVGFQAVRAATSNPVDALRDE